MWISTFLFVGTLSILVVTSYICDVKQDVFLTAVWQIKWHWVTAVGGLKSSGRWELFPYALLVTWVIHSPSVLQHSLINLLYSLLMEMAGFWRSPWKGWSDLPVRRIPLELWIVLCSKTWQSDSAPVVCCVCPVLPRWDLTQAEVQDGQTGKQKLWVPWEGKHSCCGDDCRRVKLKGCPVSPEPWLQWCVVHVLFLGIVKGTCCCCRKRGHVLSHVGRTRNLIWLNHLFHTSWGKLLPETLQCASQLDKESSSSLALT